MRLAGNRLGSMACLRQKHGRLRRHPSADQQASRGPQTRHEVGDRSGDRVCRTGETREALYRPEEDLPSPGCLFRCSLQPNLRKHHKTAPSFLPYGIVFAVKGVKKWLLLGSLSIEVAVSHACSQTCILSPSGSWRHAAFMHRLREHMIRSARHGTVPPLPRPAAMPGTPADDGVAGGIAGNRGAQAVCGPIPHADASALSF